MDSVDNLVRITGREIELHVRFLVSGGGARFSDTEKISMRLYIYIYIFIHSFTTPLFLGLELPFKN